MSIFRASRGAYFFDIEGKAGDPQNYFSKDEVVSPAVPMGRLLGWIESWIIKRRGIARGEAYKGFSDPAPVQVLALEANILPLAADCLDSDSLDEKLQVRERVGV